VGKLVNAGISFFSGGGGSVAAGGRRLEENAAQLGPYLDIDEEIANVFSPGGPYRQGAMRRKRVGRSLADEY
jgi:hypothetical protein